MAWRMFDYMSRLALAHKLELCSVVIYVGEGAGANDAGVYRLGNSKGGDAFQWRYEVVRLWELNAEDLLQTGQPALVALIGQTRITKPQVVATQAVTQIKAVSDPVQRERLLIRLAALIDNEEFSAMVEKIVEEDDFFGIETPFMRRVRESRVEGQVEGEVSTLQRTILQTLTVRFAPSETEQDALKQQMTTITDPTTLDALFTTALQAESLEAFQAALPID